MRIKRANGIPDAGNAKKNDGFTLVEMVVSFVIMMLLVTLSVGGMLAYQDYADFKRQNSYAQTLFSVAQTKLTGYSVRGQLEELEEIAVNPVELGMIVTPGGELASEQTPQEGFESGVYYLLGDRESYARYLAGELNGKTDPDSRCERALYELFEEFLFDGSVLNACIAVEYSPKSGQVYSVLYSDKCDAFTYEGTSRDGRVNVADRQEDYRNQYMIGYYGLE